MSPVVWDMVRRTTSGRSSRLPLDFLLSSLRRAFLPPPLPSPAHSGAHRTQNLRLTQPSGIHLRILVSADALVIFRALCYFCVWRSLLVSFALLFSSPAAPPCWLPFSAPLGDGGSAGGMYCLQKKRSLRGNKFHCALPCNGHLASLVDAPHYPGIANRKIERVESDSDART